MSTPLTLERVATFLGDVARPIGIITTSVGASIGTVIIAVKINPDAAAAAIFIGAVFAGVGALFGAKAWENSQAGKHSATVEVAKATTTTAPGAAP